jgi:hypothetical protein
MSVLKLPEVLASEKNSTEKQKSARKNMNMSYKSIGMQAFGDENKNLSTD